jgi:hypothetical protein
MVLQYIWLEVRSNNEFKEVRFKLRDRSFQKYQDIVVYFFDIKVIDKPTIHEYARYCMKQMTDSNMLRMFQRKITRGVQGQEQQNTMFGSQQEFNHVQKWSVS